MKKYSLIALVVLAAFMVAACSRNKLSPEADENAWIYDETLPVPIQFSSEQLFNVSTKGAPVESLAGLDVKMIAVDTTALNDVAAETAMSNVDRSLVLLKGVKATTRLGQTAKGESASEYYIQFYEGTLQSPSPKTYYYPLTTKDERKNYTFIAYNIPAANSQETEASINVASVTDASRVDGCSKDLVTEFQLAPRGARNVDVLWGIARAEHFEDSGEDYYGFNARYARKARQLGQYTYDHLLPSLTIKHVSSAIHILIEADETGGGTFVGSDPTEPILAVSNVKMKMGWVNAQMNLRTGVITHRSGDDPAGANAFALEETRPSVRVVPSALRTSGTYSSASYSLEYGTGVFTVPGERGTASNASAPVLSFTITNLDSGESEDHEITLKLPLYNALDGNGDPVYDNSGETKHYGFVAGTKYTYTISVKSVESISIHVKHIGWNENGEWFETDDNKIDLG